MASGKAMVNEVESKLRQNVALGQGGFGYAKQSNETFTLRIFRSERKVGTTFVFVDYFSEFEKHHCGKGNPTHGGETAFTGTKLQSCKCAKSVGKKYESVL